MWLRLPDGTVFNLNAARVLKVGSAGGDSANWALLAELPGGEDVVLSEYHSPQAAQEAQNRVMKALKGEERILELT